MLQALFRKLDLRDPLHPEERTALEEYMGPRRRYATGQEMVVQGSQPHESILLLEGLTARENTLQDGSRQITALHIAGDFVDLHSFLLRRMDHSVSALTDCVVTTIAHDKLRTLTSRFPHLARLLWLSTLLDAAIHRQWLVGMGQREALAQTAHLLCEMSLRLEVVGLSKDHTFDLAVHQEQLANALGRSRATVNAAIQTMRGKGLINWKGRTVRITDWATLTDMAEFDPTYLQLEAMPV